MPKIFSPEQSAELGIHVVIGYSACNAETLIASAETSMKTIKACEAERKTDVDVTKHAESVAEYYSRLLNIRPSADKLNTFTKLAMENEIFQLFCKLCVEFLDLEYMSKYLEEEEKKFQFLLKMLFFLMNTSDNNEAVSQIIAREKHFLTKATTKLKNWNCVSGDMDMKSEGGHILQMLITILHNISMYEENVAYVRDVKCIEAMEPYLNSKNNTIRLVSLATIADLLFGSECAILNTNSDIMEFLMTTIWKAVKGGTCDGWSLKELTRILQRVARYDENKRIIEQNDAVKLLLKICERDNAEEQFEAVSAIWALSYDKQIRTSMIKGEQVMPLLETLSQSRDNKLQKISKQAAWTIDFLQNSAPADKVIEARHIMISYNWTHQSVIKQIRDCLKNNCIRVWMDVDDMHGSLPEAMGKAVEQADIFLMCYSSQYMNSSNCRAEAEYAFQKKKTIIPLKMEKGFDTEGWLGLILGSKLYYDFSDEHSFEENVKKLFQAIQLELSQKNEKVVYNSKTTTHMRMQRMQAAKPMKDRNSVISWTSSQVTTWLNDNGLLNKKKGNELQQSRLLKLRGHDVAFLKLLVKSPETFYKTVQEKLEIHDLQTISDFWAALENISSDLRSS